MDLVVNVITLKPINEPMTKTFTPEITAIPIKDEKSSFIFGAEPSDQVVQNILNYSRNLEIRRSLLITDIQFIKS
jgi:hypothetical protein